MGPVWAYWAFPMERYCGDVVRNIRSRRFPYISINRYITSRAQLTHITLLYDLDEKLCLQPPASRDRNLMLDLCTFSTPQQIYEFTLVLDPLYVLTPPKRSAEVIQRSLWMKLTASLATRFDTSAQIIRRLIPNNSKFVQYGRVYQLEGGDTMHARELNPPQSDSRDMSFVRVCVNEYFRTLRNLIFPFDISFWLINSPINDAEYPSLNCGTFTANYFAF